MKKIFLILSLFIYSFVNADCNSAIQTAKNYVDTYIVPNGQNAITGQRANTALNYIITALKCVDTINDLSFTKNSSRDSFVIVYKGVRFAVKDSIGSGGGDAQTLSISNDTLTISGGNSVILPVYIQIDSSTINSYDVLNSQNTPPISPNTGDVYLVGTVPTGAWVGQAKDIAEWNGSGWVFTDGVQGDFLYNATNALTYIFRSGNWVQTTGIPALNNGNTISSGLRIGTNNARSLTFETNNVNRGRFDSVGRFYVYDTSLRKPNKYLQIDSITGRLVASEISGGVQSVVAGTNITVDNTDPENPIVNASFDYSLFPKGYEFISESRDFLPTDEGKLLVLAAGVTITMPSEFPFLANQIVGVNTLDSNCYYQDKAGSTVQIFGINNQQNEVVVLLSEPDFNSLLPISSSVIEGKTMLKYLYDKSQNAIPLSGTEIGKPVTGIIEIEGDNGNQIKSNFDDKSSGVSFNGYNSTFFATDNITGLGTGININVDNIDISCSNPTSRGLISVVDYTANITDLDYTQKKYVDNIAGKITTLGTINYEDINSSPATGDIIIELPNEIPIGYFIERYYISIDTAFIESEADFSETHLNDPFSGDTPNIYLYVIQQQTFLQNNLVGNFSTTYKSSLTITFNAVNPQNLTTGSITVKALIKKFPN